MVEANSRALLGASRSGDQEALLTLLEQHLPALRAFVRLRMSPLLRARESSADLVQSACCHFVQTLDHFDYRGEEAFRGWLYTGVLNKLREHERDLRRQKRDPRREQPLDAAGSQPGRGPAALYASILSPSQAVMADEGVRRLEAVFDELPEHYREVLTLSRIARMGRAAIAEQMSCSEDSVRGLLRRALVELAFKLDEATAEAPGDERR